ncbi:MAG: GTP-dependent dephospho-CoA kinase, partial [Thermoproteota archaeon]|nr:GTP-dependent dephospho-CoA kinase [Thermoproteota archaeon]
MRVKHPLGTLILGQPDEAMRTLKTALEREKPSKLIVVGDFVTLNTIKYNISADTYIIDNKVMRKPVESISIGDMKILRARNPPGEIIEEAWEATKKVVEDFSKCCLIIDGEEDLLTLPAIKFAPKRAIIVYGQPHVGIVLVNITESKKKEIDFLIEKME